MTDTKKPETLTFINRSEIDRPAFRLALEAAPNGQLIVDHQGKIIFSNKTLARMFAYEPEELNGKTVEFLVPKQFRDHHTGYRKEFSRSPQTRIMGAGRDLFAARKNGTEFPVEIGLNPLFTDKGTIVLATVVDITERKKNELLIASKNKELETLLYITSHDLREPLRSIQNFSQILHDEHGKNLNEEARDYLTRVLGNANRMNLLLDNVLTLSRSKQMDNMTEIVDLNVLIGDVLEHLQEIIKSTGTKIRLSPDLPHVLGNHTWTKHALVNLLGNAIKFTNPGMTPDIEILPCTLPDTNRKDMTGIAIMDRGPGVPEQYREKIFGLFQRAVSRKIEGTGAGLTIVRSVAEQQGGQTWVEPRVGGGATFIITFRKAESK